jgi:hypothetical protein
MCTSMCTPTAVLRAVLTSVRDYAVSSSSDGIAKGSSPRTDTGANRSRARNSH